MNRFEAALLGAKEVGFTVLSISISLIAVFIPILLMGGIVGRLFREFAITLSAAVLVSLVISLTTTPMMCRLPGRPAEAATGDQQPGRRASSDAASAACARVYERALRLGAGRRAGDAGRPGRDHRAQRLSVRRRPQGLLPAAGHRPDDRRPAGRPVELVQDHPASACASSSSIIGHDPAVQTVVAFAGGSSAAGGFMFVDLKPRNQRKGGADDGDAAAAAEAGQRHRRQPVPEPGAGRARRRPAEQRHLPVHAGGRQPGRPAHLGHQARRRR